MKSFEEQMRADKALIEAVKSQDRTQVEQALLNGGNPNCKVEIQGGKNSMSLYDYCKNLKGKKGKKIQDLLEQKGGFSIKRNAQKKHHTYRQKISTHTSQNRKLLEQRQIGPRE